MRVLATKVAREFLLACPGELVLVFGEARLDEQDDVDGRGVVSGDKESRWFQRDLSSEISVVGVGFRMYVVMVSFKPSFRLILGHSFMKPL